MAALGWINPLWDSLLDALSAREDSTLDNNKLKALNAQQQIVLTHIALQASTPDQACTVPLPQNDKIQLHISAAALDHLTIINASIPAASDRDDRAALLSYETLRQPLPFIKLPELNTIMAIRGTLLSEFPWAREAISLVMSELLARKRHGAQRLGMAPVLLVGPPGSGKTRFAQRLGQLFSTPSLFINLAGASDVKLLKGVTHGWASSRPSRIVEFIGQTKVPNPIIVLDEVDKTAQYGNGGDPQDALLDLLEPGNARHYQDIFLMTVCDISHCLYILTSNSLERLSEPLKSRVRPVYFPAPQAQHAPAIINGLVKDVESAWALPEGSITLTHVERQSLAGLTPREMRFALIDMLGASENTLAH